MAAESQLPGEEISERSSIAPTRPPMMSRPQSIQSTGSAGSRDRHMLVCKRYPCSSPPLLINCSSILERQIVKYLHRRCAAAKWLQPIEDDDGMISQTWTGVAVRLPDGNYTTEPQNMDRDFYRVLQSFNCKAAVTMSSEITSALLDQIGPFQTELQVAQRGMKIQIVQSLAELASGTTVVTKKSYMCILREERVVLLWNDSVEGILTHGTDVEGILVGIVSLDLDYMFSTDHFQDLGLTYWDYGFVAVSFNVSSSAHSLRRQLGSGNIGKDGYCSSSHRARRKQARVF